LAISYDYTLIVITYFTWTYSVFVYDNLVRGLPTLLDMRWDDVHKW